MRAWPAAVVLLFALAPAAAVAKTIPPLELPAGTMPEAIVADEEGDLWFSMSGAWAIGRSTPSETTHDTYPLPENRTGALEELFDVHIDASGRVWTASNRHAFRLDPATGDIAAFELPTPTDISGGIGEAPGLGLVVAEVTAERLAVLDPDTGVVVKEIQAAARDFGPLDLSPGPGGALYGSATYGNGLFVVTADGVEPLAMGALFGPVGVAWDGSDLWTAEMGGSSVARMGPDGSGVERFPTTPSHYYPISGPAGITVDDDGTIWFVEHFADRVAHLDPARRVLEEVQLAGAPGTNAQFLALSRGVVWVPMASRDAVAGVEARPVGEPPFTVSNPSAEVPIGGTVTLRIEAQAGTTGGQWVVGTGADGPTAEVTPEGDLVITAPPGTREGGHWILVAYDRTTVSMGRYVSVSVRPTASVGEDDGGDGTPFAGGVAVALALGAVGASLRRRRA